MPDFANSTLTIFDVYANNEWLDGFGIGVAGTWGRIDEQGPTSFRTTAASTNFFAYRGLQLSY
jgi:hypothetical protein